MAYSPLCCGMPNAWISLLLVAASIIGAPHAPAVGEPATRAACAFPARDSGWTAMALDGWQRQSSRALHASPIRFPTLVLFDTLCSYTLLPASDRIRRRVLHRRGSAVRDAKCPALRHHSPAEWRVAAGEPRVVRLSHAERRHVLRHVASVDLAREWTKRHAGHGGLHARVHSHAISRVRLADRRPDSTWAAGADRRRRDPEAVRLAAGVPSRV